MRSRVFKQAENDLSVILAALKADLSGRLFKGYVFDIGTGTFTLTWSVSVNSESDFDSVVGIRNRMESVVSGDVEEILQSNFSISLQGDGKAALVATSEEEKQVCVIGHIYVGEDVVSGQVEDIPLCLSGLGFVNGDDGRG